MTVVKTRIKSLVILAGCCIAGGILMPPAMAQTTDRAVAYKQVARACVEESKRFCPGLDPGVVQPRSEAMCLKTYKSSLSSACRRAVKATSP